jgi:hypothetical protein
MVCGQTKYTQITNVILPDNEKEHCFGFDDNETIAGKLVTILQDMPCYKNAITIQNG